MSNSNDKLVNLLKAVLAEMESASEEKDEERLLDKAATVLAREIAEVAPPALKRFGDDGKLAVCVVTGEPGTVISSMTWVRIIRSCVLQYGLALAAEAQVLGYNDWIADRFRRAGDMPDDDEDVYQHSLVAMIRLLSRKDQSD